MALSVSHYHANGQSIPYPRPDRVIKTGVIAPYPIRQHDPVALARNTITPFINDIRPMGPELNVSLMGNGFGAAPGAPGAYLPRSPLEHSGRQAMLAAKNATRFVPFARSMGTSRMVTATQIAPAPSTLQYEYAAARAGYGYNQAASFGTRWDMIRARQREVAMMRRRGGK